MVQFDSGFTTEERAKMRKLLKDSRCFDNGEQCSINCDWLSLCDPCYDEEKLTPFCRMQFRDLIYGKPVKKDIEGDDVCSLEYHMANYEDEEEDKRSTCPKCGFKTDSETIMKIHSCRASQSIV